MEVKPLVDYNFGRVLFDPLAEEKSVKITTMRKIPRNAFLVSILNPTWLQVCRGKVAITSGFLWCDEDIGEYSGKELAIKKAGNEWLVKLPHISGKAIAAFYSLKGQYGLRGNKMYKAGTLPDGENALFSDNSIRIMIDGTDVVAVTEGLEANRIPYNELFVMDKIEFNGERLYGPRYYVYDMIEYTLLKNVRLNIL